MASLPLGGADGGYHPDGIPPPLGELEGAIIRMASFPLGGADGGYHPDGIPPPWGSWRGLLYCL